MQQSSSQPLTAFALNCSLKSSASGERSSTDVMLEQILAVALATAFLLVLSADTGAQPGHTIPEPTAPRGPAIVQPQLPERDPQRGGEAEPDCQLEVEPDEDETVELPDENLLERCGAVIEPPPGVDAEIVERPQQGGETPVIDPSQLPPVENGD